MNRRSDTKLVREGAYAADVPVDLIEDDTGWSPYLWPEDAYSSTTPARRCAPATLRAQPSWRRYSAWSLSRSRETDWHDLLLRARTDRRARCHADEPGIGFGETCRVSFLRTTRRPRQVP